MELERHNFVKLVNFEEEQKVTLNQINNKVQKEKKLDG